MVLLAGSASALGQVASSPHAPASIAPAQQVETVAPTATATPQPAEAPAPIPLRRSAPAVDKQQPSTTSSGIETWRIVMALAVVLGLIFVLRWLGRRVTGHAASRHSRAIQVVSRSMVAPKQQLMLVQVGRRLVLVGNCGTSMNPLCEIADADEITEVLGQVQQEKNESISKAFSGLFRREEEKFDADDGVARPAAETFPDEHDRDIDPDGPLGTTKQELHELLDKVRGMARTFRK